VVAEIVTRLDGMPLAIELAAARVEALGVAQLRDRLDDRFTVLTAGDRLAPVRHQSLAATVEWSYRVLGQPDQRVFRLVSVFPGPFTLEAAEAVAGPGADRAVLRLVDCSLLIPPRNGPDGRARYMGLDWCAVQVWLGRLAAMMADYAAAADHFTLACDALAAAAPSAVLADGLAGRSTALRNLGRLAEATKDAQRALAMADELGYPAGQAFALIQLGILGNYQGEYQASLAWLRQAQQVDPARVPGRLVRQGNTVLAMVLTADGQVAAAERMSVDALAQARQAGDPCRAPIRQGSLV
jgi:tetratricopeptide (TPR) repeat protein